MYWYIPLLTIIFNRSKTTEKRTVLGEIPSQVFSVPTSQSKVRVATKGLQAYTTSNGWLSAIVNNG